MKGNEKAFLSLKKYTCRVFSEIFFEYHECLFHPKEFGEDFIDFTKVMICQGKAKTIFKFQK